MLFEELPIHCLLLFHFIFPDLCILVFSTYELLLKNTFLMDHGILFDLIMTLSYEIQIQIR